MYFYGCGGIEFSRSYAYLAIGEAAGVGASVAVDRQIEPAKVDSSEVAKILRKWCNTYY